MTQNPPSIDDDHIDEMKLTATLVAGYYTELLEKHVSVELAAQLTVQYHAAILDTYSV